MSTYIKQEWIDHIEDIETGELLQEGTLYCARLMNHMEDGIESAHLELISFESIIKALQTRIQVLEGNLTNNMPNNNFMEDFMGSEDDEGGDSGDGLNTAHFGDIIIIEGILDPISKKVYY